MKYVIALLALLAGISAQAATLSYTDGAGTVSCSTTTTAPVIVPTPTPAQPVAASSCAAQGLTVKADITAMNWGVGVTRYNLNLKPNEAYVWSFIPNPGGTSIKTMYNNASRLITISTSACGAPVNNQAACSMQQNAALRTGNSGPAYSTSVSGNAGICFLPPLPAGQTYYVNIRNSIPNSNPIQSSCSNTAGCTFALTY